MTTQEYDTDPSTPGAKRLSDPRPAALESLEDPQGASPEDAGDASSRARPTTDPGIAPPPQPLPVPGQPMGIVVPSVARTSNDSVDALLEGIRREQFERGGTPQTSQTDGQATAAYHSEHKLQAAQAAAQVEAHQPTVLVERPLLEQTVRIRVGGSKALAPRADSGDATQPTAAGSRSIMLRMAVAVLAGVVVVVLIFAAFERLSGQRGQVVQEAPVPVPALPTSQPGAVQGPDPSAANLPKSASPATSVVPIEAIASSTPPPAVASVSTTTRKPASAKPSKPKSKPAASGAKPASDDLGEFKSAF